MKNSLVVMRSLAAQKIRSLNSLESFTVKIAERNHLVDLMNSLMRRVRSSRSKYLLGGGGIILANTQAFDWRQAKISAEESQQYFDHIDECHDIQRKTITCKNCSKRLRLVEDKDLKEPELSHDSFLELDLKLPTSPIVNAKTPRALCTA